MHESATADTPAGTSGTRGLYAFLTTLPALGAVVRVLSDATEPLTLCQVHTLAAGHVPDANANDITNAIWELVDCRLAAATVAGGCAYFTTAAAAAANVANHTAVRTSYARTA